MDSSPPVYSKLATKKMSNALIDMIRSSEHLYLLCVVLLLLCFAYFISIMDHYGNKFLTFSVSG